MKSGDNLQASPISGVTSLHALPPSYKRHCTHALPYVKKPKLCNLIILVVSDELLAEKEKYRMISEDLDGAFLELATF